MFDGRSSGGTFIITISTSYWKRIEREREREKDEKDGEYQSPRILIILHTNRIIKTENTLFSMKSPRFSILLESVGWVEFPCLEEASNNQSSINQWTYPSLTRACMQPTTK